MTPSLPPSFSLENQVALVTGATGAIGQKIAQSLIELGATVALSGTRDSVLRDLADSLGDRASVWPAHLSCSESVEALIPAVESSLGKIDILVNNAGITRDGLALRMKDEQWESVLEINLTAAFRLCRQAIRGMVKRRYGRIINISSVVGALGNPGQANYVAAKAGLVGLSKSLALELASRNITVNCVAPGFIDSAMTEPLSDAVRESILRNIPMGRMGTPEEVASAISFLAMPQASYITGHTLHVNGGMGCF